MKVQRVRLLFIAVLCAACADDASSPDDNVVTALESIVTPGTRTVGDIVEVRVRARNRSGGTVANASVSFQAPSGSGTISPAEARSDAAGEARAQWTLDTRAGRQSLRVTSGGAASTIEAEARAGAPASLVKQGGDAQVGAPSTPLSTPLAASVVDAHNNPVSGVSVSFVVRSGGGSVSPAAALTDAAGVARATWTLGAGGSQELEARAGTLPATLFGATADPTFNALSIAPATWTIPVGRQVRFTAWTSSSAQPAVTWSVNGVAGGNDQNGRVASDGTYTAPAAVPAGNPVRVRATTAQGGAVEVVVTITATAGAATLRGVDFTPRVLTTAAGDSVVLHVLFTGYLGSLVLRRPNNSLLPFLPWSNATFRLALPAAVALNGYMTGDLHNFIGYLESADMSGRYNAFVNVRDATVPDAPIIPLSATAQRTDWLLNLRNDSIQVGLKPQLLPAFLALAPDVFDFVAIIDNVVGFANRTYLGVRNDVQGIGVPIFNNNGSYGGSTRLLGTISYPIDSYFDLAETASSHEIGHRWINHLDNPIMAAGVPHWPISSMARDVMGHSLAGGVGGAFPYEVRPRGDGTSELVCSPVPGVFSDLSLYLMGLIPPGDVQPHVVFNNQQMPLQCGAVSATTAFTVNDVIAANGVRQPDHTQSPRSFRVGTLILSRGRLLNADEMAFFSHMAARGEARTELQYSSGFSRGMTKPFYLATGGRATLQTRMW